MNNYGFQEVWHNCGTIHAKSFSHELILCLQNVYSKKWFEQLNANHENNKLRTYCKFNHEFEPEKSLFTVKKLVNRRLFTQLRISAHDLHIETGRYNKPEKTPVSNRLCRFCNLNKVEDEFHVLMDCDFYKDLREVLFTNLAKCSLFDQLPDGDAKFLFLMSSNNGD